MLSGGIIVIGLWVVSASHTLNSACTLNAHTGVGTSCVSGLPFKLLGIALMMTGGVSVIVQLVGLTRAVRRRSIPRQSPAITTLHEYEVELLRDVA